MVLGELLLRLPVLKGGKSLIYYIYLKKYISFFANFHVQIKKDGMHKIICILCASFFLLSLFIFCDSWHFSLNPDIYFQMYSN